MFERERARVQEALGPIVVTVEHVGSTAVPGLAAKPIIDLLVGVRSLPEARTCCVEPLEALRYRYMAEYEAWLPNEMLFRKGPPGPWTHHVHLMETTCPAGRSSPWSATTCAATPTWRARTLTSSGRWRWCSRTTSPATAPPRRPSSRP